MGKKHEPSVSVPTVPCDLHLVPIGCAVRLSSSNFGGWWMITGNLGVMGGGGGIGARLVRWMALPPSDPEHNSNLGGVTTIACSGMRVIEIVDLRNHAGKQ